MFVMFIFYSFVLETHVKFEKVFRILYYIPNTKPNQNFCKTVFLNFLKSIAPFKELF